MPPPISSTADEIGLADTTGYAVPSQVIDMFRMVTAAGVTRGFVAARDRQVPA